MRLEVPLGAQRGYVGLLRLADVMVLVKWPDELVSAKNGRRDENTVRGSNSALWKIKNL